MAKRKQDATDQVVGYFYQYWFAVAECLYLQNGYLVIEKLGDVSLLNDESEIVKQYEIKFHESDKTLSDRNIDFWKTIYNWLDNYDISSKCESLILHTTSTISKTSIFYNWNLCTNKEKYSRMFQIYKEDNELLKENPRVKYYETIFSKENYSKLLDILDKQIIETQSNGFEFVRRKIMTSPILQVFSEPQKKMLSDELYANLINIPTIKNNQSWTISYKEILKLLNQLIGKMNFDGIPVIEDIFYDKNPTAENKELYKEKKFIKEIQKIEYDEQIEIAMRDYFKANINLDSYFKDYVSFEGEYNIYKKNLSEKINNLKTKKKLEICKETIIKDSKIFYHEGLDLTPTTTLKFNSESIKKGIVHNIVDEGNITWHLGEK